ncbi:MAG: hypothetical protein U9N51_03830, partial [Bacteroidota bacterium]|nr:hypothetical protein [Bacteroidota bacterium]
WAGYFVGNTKTTGYLLVGDPDEPSGVAQNDINFYHIDFSSNKYWSYILLVCNNADGGLWSISTDHIKFDNTGTTEHYRALHSPYIWFPGVINTADTRVEINHDCTLENGYDGAYLEWDYNNDGNYTKITSWSSNGYTAGVDGCDQACTQPNTDAWTDGSFTGQQTSVSNALSNVPTSSWVRFRLVGMEDNSTGTGDYRAYEFWVKGNDIDFGSSGFEQGGIYAEGHVFAQSNAQIGDVAEFFPVQGTSKAGDLISMDKTGSELTYVTSEKMDPLVIGVHSSSPSVLVNNPENGIPVGLSGRIPVNVTNENGNIKPGDYLTSSSKQGFAMKATENCFVVGRAMEKLNTENGKVLCMISPGWYNSNPKSEGVISGDYSLIQGQKTVKVIDEKVHEGSRVFVTMRDDPGSYFWVKTVKNGYFEISVKNAPQKSVPFDYLINNASTVKEIEKTINEELITKKADKKIKDGNNNEACEDCEREMIYIGPNKDNIDMSHIAISSNPPSPPPDINKAWTWDPVNGFKELDVDINKMVNKKREKKEASSGNIDIDEKIDKKKNQK